MTIEAKITELTEAVDRLALILKAALDAKDAAVAIAPKEGEPTKRRGRPPKKVEVAEAEVSEEEFDDSSADFEDVLAADMAATLHVKPEVPIEINISLKDLQEICMNAAKAVGREKVMHVIVENGSANGKLDGLTQDGMNATAKALGDLTNG